VPLQAVHAEGSGCARVDCTEERRRLCIRVVVVVVIVVAMVAVVTSPTYVHSDRKCQFCVTYSGIL
jgi:hypothetical protein